MKKVNKKQSFPDTSNVRFRGDQMKSMWQVQHKQMEVFFLPGVPLSYGNSMP